MMTMKEYTPMTYICQDHGLLKASDYVRIFGFPGKAEGGCMEVMAEVRAGQGLSNSIDPVLSGSPLPFIPHPSPPAA
jgi:hypothetical protein